MRRHNHEHACDFNNGTARVRLNNNGQINGRGIDKLRGDDGLVSVRFPRRNGWADPDATKQARNWCIEEGGTFTPMRNREEVNP